MTAVRQGNHEIAAAAPPAVVVDGVSKSYGDVVAVRNVSLEIGRGEFFTLLGPSGCGKTTTLRMIAGFILPGEGRILIDGRDVTLVPPNRRPSNMVFQQYALFPHLSVRENVAFGPREARLERGEIARRVGEALELVQLGPLADRRPSQLSGGQQQRVALARALVNRPSVLLLDEPLGALDLKMRKAMQFELKRIQREVGITFVYVTHDQDEALTMSDRIAVMNHGVAEQVGSPRRSTACRARSSWRGSSATPTSSPGACPAWRATRSSLPSRPGSTFLARAVDKFEPGSAAVAVVRPENVRLAAAGDGAGVITGVLVETVFQGSVIRAVVEVADGTRIVATLPPGGDVPVSVGRQVGVTWDSGSATAFGTGEAADLAAASGSASQARTNNRRARVDSHA